MHSNGAVGGDKSAVCFLSFTAEGTRALAGCVARHADWGRFIGLYGELGAGKTEFVRGVAEALKASEEVSSPTYVLENVYTIPSGSGTDPRSVHHWDFYRVGGSYEEGDLLDYRGDQSKLVIAEWPERVPWVDQLVHTKVVFSYREDGDSEEPSGQAADAEGGSAVRIIAVSGVSDELRAALEEFSADGIAHVK